MEIIWNTPRGIVNSSGSSWVRPKFEFDKKGISVQSCQQYAPLAQIELTPSLEVRVDMADMKVEKRPVTLVTNVGSCIAICIHDSTNNCGGMAHIMLPTANGANNSLPFKYADTAVPALAENIKKLGKGKVNLLAKIAGGANMFSNLRCQLLNIGEKNAEAVKVALKTYRIPLIAEDVGGSSGRRVAFDVATGVMRVKTIDGDEKVL
ncbi:MAG: chemotaxis protein CheD [Candidatus Jordarchaeaceae archaeon]